MKHWATLLLAALLAGCGGLQPQQTEPQHLYLLDAHPAAAAQQRLDLTLAVSMPDAWPGFDTPQMVYQQVPYELAYFARHRWADTPAHMLQPLMSRALQPGFRAIVPASGSADADLRLDTELIRLQQDFTAHPSRIELTVRAQLVRNRRVIASQLFSESEAAASEDAYGGVAAANRAAQRLLEHLADFCRNAAAAP